MMHDGKALQSGTSHNFGDGFAKAFGIQYLDENNEQQYVHQTCLLYTSIAYFVHIGIICAVPLQRSGVTAQPPRAQGGQGSRKIEDFLGRRSTCL